MTLIRDVMNTIAGIFRVTLKEIIYDVSSSFFKNNTSNGSCWETFCLILSLFILFTSTRLTVPLFFLHFLLTMFYMDMGIPPFSFTYSLFTSLSLSALVLFSFRFIHTVLHSISIPFSPTPCHVLCDRYITFSPDFFLVFVKTTGKICIIPLTISVYSTPQTCSSKNYLSLKSLYSPHIKCRII